MSTTPNDKQNSPILSDEDTRANMGGPGELPVKRAQPDQALNHPDASLCALKRQRFDEPAPAGSSLTRTKADPLGHGEETSPLSLASSIDCQDPTAAEQHQRKREIKATLKQSGQASALLVDTRQHSQNQGNGAGAIQKYHSTCSPDAMHRITHHGGSQVVNDSQMHPESVAESETMSRIGASAVSRPGGFGRSQLDNGTSCNDPEEDEEERKMKRLVQNRKSAQKCRVKKKEEFGHMKVEVNMLKQENKDLKEKLNEVTIMLYRKIEENQSLNKRLEQNQMNHTIFLTKLLLNHENQAKNSFDNQGGSGENLHSLIKTHLASFSSAKTQSSANQMSPSTFLQQQCLGGPGAEPPVNKIRKDSNMFNIKTPEIVPSSSLALEMNQSKGTRSQLGDNSSGFQMPQSMMQIAASHFQAQQSKQRASPNALSDQVAQTLAQNSGLWNRLQAQQQQPNQNCQPKQEAYSSAIGEFLQKIQQQKYMKQASEQRTPEPQQNTQPLKQNFSFQRNFQ